jgi:hypothetical protein
MSRDGSHGDVTRHDVYVYSPRVILSNSGGRGGGSWRLGRDRRRSSAVTVDLGLGAITGDVARLAAAVAGLSRSVERTTVGSSAVARDVAQLSAGVALHGLGLAVARKVVRSTALVASGRARASGISSTEASCESATGSTSAATDTASGRVRAVTGQMAGEATGVASSARAGAAQAQSRAVGLDVTQALAVVALLRLGGTRVRASVRLVAGLLACNRSVLVEGCGGVGLTVVAKPLGRGAHLCWHVSRVSSTNSRHTARACATQVQASGTPSRDKRARSACLSQRAGRLTSVVSDVSALEARTAG